MVNKAFILNEAQKQLEAAIFRFNKWNSKKTNHFHTYQNEINNVMVNFIKKELKIFGSYSLRSMNPSNVYVKLDSKSITCSGITFSEHRNAFGTRTKGVEYNEEILEILQQASNKINYNAKSLAPDYEYLHKGLSNHDEVIIKNFNFPLSLEESVEKILNNVKNYKI